MSEPYWKPFIKQAGREVTNQFGDYRFIASAAAALILFFVTWWVVGLNWGAFSGLLAVVFFLLALFIRALLAAPAGLYREQQEQLSVLREFRDNLVHGQDVRSQVRKTINEITGMAEGYERSLASSEPHKPPGAISMMLRDLQKSLVEHNFKTDAEELAYRIDALDSAETPEALLREASAIREMLNAKLVSGALGDRVVE